MNPQIDLYYWPTPNGWKISIALEELELPYKVIPVDIGAGEQFEPAFLALNPNNKIPVIVDPDGPDGAPITLFDSGAILVYLAEKTGQLMPSEVRARYTTLQWLMFQVSGVGPMLGQAHHFRIYAPETIEYAVERYTQEAARMYRVLDRRLGDAEYLGGAYSIADIATFPWISRHERQGQDLADYPNLNRWYQAIAARPAVKRGLAVLDDRGLPQNMDDKTRATLFGKTQFERR
jgi:GST-like protein